MDLGGTVYAAMEFALRETALFAAFGFLILGISDLAVDLAWSGLALVRGKSSDPAAELADPDEEAPLAVLVAAWDEAEVIGAMLDHALGAWGDGGYRIFVGCYPNDPGTIAALLPRASDPRVRIVVGPVPGPTTKADCLNRLWEAIRLEEERTGRRFAAALLHDAEDVVHSSELRLFAAACRRHALVQLPVLPLIDPGSRWIGGHYADEFAEAHGKELVVRQALGAGLPSAGVGCAIARDALDALASAYGTPFDPHSLTEDYELGLRIRMLGLSAAFLRAPAAPGRPPIATRAYFPATLEAAVTQKARWTTGIALSGWDRLGWQGGLAERWMRLRDRQSPLAALILFAGYVALLLWTLLFAWSAVAGRPGLVLTPVLQAMLAANALLLLWRLAWRFGFVTRAYGWREGLRAVPRVVVGNAIAMLAARRAVLRYVGIRRTGFFAWDKTAHAFPRTVPAE